jgi:ankyrin repeat protein
MALMLLETGMNAHVVDWQGRGAFHHVAKMEKPSNTTEDLRPRLIQELLKSGLDINLRDKQGKTPMHIYVSEYRHSSDPNDTLFSALEAAGADLKAKDPDGMTPLFVRFVHKPSYTKEAIELCEKVLAYEGALEMKDYQGRGLLHAASEDSDPEFIKWLVSQGVDTKATDFDGHTPFHHAVRKTKKFRRYSAASLNGILDVLIEVGIDPFQPNRFGRTPLHSVSAAKNPDAFNYVLKLYEDVNQTDHAGVTPLHLAATFSEYHTKRLLEAGADPSMATHEGMTALHLAARNRQPNILGLLLESLESRVGRDKTKPVLEAMVQFNTAMYYACASGMIESVRLLLEAGASVRSDSFLHQGLHGCRDFETEQRNWPSGGHTDSENERNTPDAGSVSVDDNHRTWKKQDGRYPFTRLDEILALIASESSLEPKQIGYAITYAASKGHDYTVDCMLRIRSQLAPEEPLKHTHESIASIARWGAMRGNYKKRENPVEVLRDDILTDSLSSFDFLMSVREYELAGDRLAHIECVTPRRYDDRSIMAEMIDGGFSSMLKRMLTPQILSRLENAEGTEETSSGHRNGLPESPEPPLVSACHRESPNMDVITLLVEEMKVDVNGHRKLAEAKQDIYSNYVLYETALHALARGDHWWQSALGIPYLVKHGANLEARNSQGSTPLNAAIGRLAEARSLNKRAIKTLVKLGADVNSVDSRGRSCLMQAAGDSEILKLLLEHGARVGPKDLLAQIQSKNCEQLELMLQSGVDPNEQIECDTRGNKTDPTYLLDHVTTCYESREGWMIYEQMARVLLKYGADPNARYSDTTVAHKAVGSGTFASLFLELPTLEVEATDSAGMTMFLLACKKVFNGGSDSKYYGQPHMEISLPRILINRGVNIYARDNQGRNALHCLLSSDIVLKDHDLLRQLASEADLINSPDNQGQTPIHYALERYTRAVEEVNILLAAGADPWISDNKGNNVLHWAFWKGVWRELPDRQEKEVYCDILERLLELPGAEAYVNARNEAGETPIFGFMRSGEKSYSFRNRNWQSATYNPPKTPEPAFKLFDEVGVDWFVINNEGQTLLHVAADTYDDIGAVRFETLLSKGLDPKAEDSKHQTPLDIAAARGRKKILDLFQAPDRQQREQVIVDDIYEDDDL